MSDPTSSEAQPIETKPSKPQGCIYAVGQFFLGVLLGIGITGLVPYLVASVMGRGEGGGIGGIIMGILVAIVVAVVGNLAALVYLVLSGRWWIASGVVVVLVTPITLWYLYWNT